MNFLKIRLAAILLAVIVTGCSGSDTDDQEPDKQPLSTHAYFEFGLYNNGFIHASTIGYDEYGIQNFYDNYDLDSELKTITRTNSRNDYIEVYYFNSGGKIIKYLRSNSDHDIEEVYKYNDREQIIKKSRRNPLNGEILSVHTWEYDSNGLLTAAHGDWDNDGIFENSSIYTWIDGKKISRVNQHNNVDSHTFGYQYSNSSGLPSVRTRDVGSDGTIDKTQEYEYDSNGNMVHYENYDAEGRLTGSYDLEYIRITNTTVPNTDLFYLHYFL